MKIAIIGHGWLGERIANHLSEENSIFATTTSKAKAENLQAKGYIAVVQEFKDALLDKSIASWQALNEIDIIIITIPFPRRTELAYLKNRFKNLIKFLQGFKGQMFLMSSTGIYPQEAKEITENTYEDEQLHPNLIAIENLMREKFPQLNILRLSGLMGDDRLLKNYKISNTSGAVNYVHYEDVAWVIKEMIMLECQSKLFNVVAPMHPTKQEILNEQKNLNDPILRPNKVRIIKSDKLQIELNYQFSHPNPIYFE